MKLIHFRGLNCYLASVINIVDSLGVNYPDAFGTLWSETDFTDDPTYNLYLSQRVLPNLEALGVKLEVLSCASNYDANTSFSLIPIGELFVVGMDTFHIPWSLFYQKSHEMHYFFARKKNQNFVICFDPTYKKDSLQFTSGDIAPHAFDLLRIHKLAVNPQKFDIRREAEQIIIAHPETMESLSVEIKKCNGKNREKITRPIKQITAMVNNRYLFQHFLHQFSFGEDPRFFNKDFFAKWEAVKNGLYKAYIMKNNENVLDEVCTLFKILIAEETGMAEKIITEHSASCCNCKTTSAGRTFK